MSFFYGKGLQHNGLKIPTDCFVKVGISVHWSHLWRYRDESALCLLFNIPFSAFLRRPLGRIISHHMGPYTYRHGEICGDRSLCR